MNKEEERSYLQFIKNLNDRFGISKIDYLVSTKAYEILGMSKDDSFHPKNSQERFDLIKREFATDIKLLNFGKELITKSASILKVPTLRAAYDDKILFYKETNLWDGIKIMAVDGSLKKSEFKKALKILNLDNKGYTLYSFKHFSNLQRFHAGWTIAEIMKANRHSSITMTETYLKNINKVTDISKKDVPKI